jgi:hypothetical protein
MKLLQTKILPILLATIWISISEFFRNEFLFKQLWLEHFNNLGLIFPSDPINGAIWGLWSLFLAIGIWLVATKFSFWETIGISWLFGFVLMWISIGNLGVFPFALLYFAIPLSLIEVAIATIIIKYFSKKNLS